MFAMHGAIAMTGVILVVHTHTPAAYIMLTTPLATAQA